MAYDFGFSGVYDKFTDEDAFQQRVSYILSLLSEHGVNNGIVLDLACGTGRLSAELIRNGYDVISVDNAPDMLSRARDRLAHYGDKALVLEQDMRELDLYGTVKATVCIMDSVNHLLAPEDVKRVFERVSLFTEPGGLFIFDVNTQYKHKYILGNNTFVYEDETDYLVWQNEYEENTDTVHMLLDLFSETADGTYARYCDEISERAYGTEEIKTLLTGAGFKDVFVFGDGRFAPPRENEERIYFTAVKGEIYG